MAIIEDGGGKNPKAQTSSDGRLNVSARANSRSFYISRDKGQTFQWASSFDATTGALILYIKNTSKTLKLYIDEVEVSGDVRATYELRKVTGDATGTAGVFGDTSTANIVNLNFTSGNTPDALSLLDAPATGTSSIGRIEQVTLPSDTVHTLDIDDTLILGQNDAVGIQFTGSGNVNSHIRGFFDE